MHRYITVLLLMIGVFMIPMEGYSYIYHNVSDRDIQKSVCCQKHSKHKKCHDKKHACANSFSCAQTISLHLPAASYKVNKKNRIADTQMLPINYKELSLLSVYISKWVPPKIS